MAALLLPLLPTSPDSCVIVTSRNDDLLRQAAVTNVEPFPVEQLHREEAYELFCRHALLQMDPPPHQQAMVQQVVEACGQLPLSLKVMGKQLAWVPEESQWAAVLSKLRQARSADGSADDELFSVLKISYDMLEDELKQVFLDVACLLLDVPMCANSWGDGSQADLRLLEHLSLVEVINWKYPEPRDRFCLRMHDQLRDLAYKLVRQSQSSGLSRVWDSDNAASVRHGNKVSPSQ